MKLKDVGEVIAVRKLVIEDDTGSKDVFVMIGKPQKYQKTTDYYCPVQIKGIGLEKIEYTVGVDAVQAIQFAFKWAGAILSHEDTRMGGKLRWEGADNSGDFGLHP